MIETNPLNRTELIAHLRELDACDTALAWIAQTPGEPADLWAACQRGDWMIWLLVAANYDERTLRHIACDVAEDVLPIYERAHPDDRRPRDCIAVARRYADGAATYRELIAASDAASDAARAAADYAAYAGAAYAAAKAAAWAASSDAARAAANAAADAAAKAALWATARAAADAASSAASWAASDAARAAAIARHADMVRARVSWADVERAMERTAREGEERRDA